MPLLVVFDLDGTLVDTAPDLIETLNVVFAREHLPPVDYATGRSLIGGGTRKMIEGALAVGRRPAPADAVDRMFEAFVAYYAEHVADRSRPFPGVEAALDRLTDRGCRFAVCTNKLERLSRLLLDALGLAPRFAAICGQDTFGIPKPDPRMLLHTVEAAGGHPEGTVMVGDSGTDIATARAAGIPVVAVDFGYTETSIQSLGPDRLIGHFDQLAAAIAEVAPNGL